MCLHELQMRLPAFPAALADVAATLAQLPAALARVAAASSPVARASAWVCWNACRFGSPAFSRPRLACTPTPTRLSMSRPTPTARPVGFFRRPLARSRSSSVERGEGRPDSDVDVAALYGKPVEPGRAGLELALAGDLDERLGRLRRRLPFLHELGRILEHRTGRRRPPPTARPGTANLRARPAWPPRGRPPLR